VNLICLWLFAHYDSTVTDEKTNKEDSTDNPGNQMDSERAKGKGECIVIILLLVLTIIQQGRRTRRRRRQKERRK
jgi:hypothetical protein